MIKENLGEPVSVRNWVDANSIYFSTIQYSSADLIKAAYFVRTPLIQLVNPICSDLLGQLNFNIRHYDSVK